MVSIATSNLTIRQLDIYDATLVLAYQLANREFLKRWTPQRGPEFYSEEHQRQILETGLSENMLRLHLFQHSDQHRIIGDITLYNIVLGSFRSCHLGYGLLESYQGKGLMAEALSASIGHAFDKMQLHRIQANVLPDNDRSIRLLEKLKFKREGYHEKYLSIDGHWQDHVSYALINDRVEP